MALVLILFPGNPFSRTGKGSDVYSNLPSRESMEEFLAARGADEAQMLTDEAEELIMLARANSRKGVQNAYAIRALELSPLCSEAFAVLAQNASKPDDAAKIFQLNLSAAELCIRAGLYSDERGQLRRERETRSHLQARADLATELWALGEYDEAIFHHRQILAMNPIDELGIRRQFAAHLFERGKFDELRQLIERFGKDPALEQYRARMVEAERQQSADALHACAAYLSDLQSLLRPHFTDSEWNTLFDGIETPEKAARNVLMRRAGLPARSSQFWTLLDLSTGHLRPGDIALLEQYRGPDWEGERDRDPGQTLFLSPVVGGWLITPVYCLAGSPDHLLSPVAKAELNEQRREVIAGIRSEGFSDEFIAIFKYAYENRADEIRFHRDADYVPDFRRFDLEPGEIDGEYEAELASGA